ncbi:hypothetical protein L211DRAFT_851758 [Terfezia boudieri ATCC MYA-4762]|uniref:Uncharacterized protein n=1 Tax=Terfezia boudieri ATCC MYA-4762 TaxID=1051890 RepID=A0A3N4LSP8_9PEZI|nr:hypothetical protein L211DRAFT_851758 [Terfezia boudieri ATCC MYA-4762]
MREEDGFERRELVNDILQGGVHFNFPKIHLISHYAEQIPKFGALGQYSTDISEAMHKGLKEAYRRSNKVNSTPQIVTTYTRDHTLAMKDLTIDVWNQIRQKGDLTPGVGRSTTEMQVYLKLRGKIKLGIISSLEELERVTGLPDLVLTTETFLRQEVRSMNSDPVGLLVQEIRAYRELQIPVPKFSGEGFIVHSARCTVFREQERYNWIWVRRQRTSDEASGTLNGRIPGRINALLKVISREGMVYRLAHVDLLQCIGGDAVQGSEGMVRVGWPLNGGGIIVKISQIEGIAHLIPLELGESWLVNNRIDLETWNMVYDL